MFRNRYDLFAESHERMRSVDCVSPVQITDGSFRTSQKPDEELICNFKKSFPNVVAGVTFTGAGPPEQGIMEPGMPARCAYIWHVDRFT